MKRIIYLLVFLIASTSGLNAQINILDKTFGEDGKTVLIGPKNLNGCLITDIAILPNNKIVVCGIIYDSVPSVTLFASRYSENGGLDTSFGTNGYFIADDTLLPRSARLTLDQDGSIYVYGSHSPYFQHPESPFLLRLFEDGTLDTSFAEDGIYGLNDTIGYASIYCVYIEKDKSLKVIGQTYFGDPIFPYIQKFTPNGQLDQSFGKNGRKLIGLGGTVSIAAIDASIDQDGRLLLFVYIDPANAYNYSVIRTGLDGVADSAFGDKGIAHAKVGSSASVYMSGCIMRDNSLLCVINSSELDYRGYIEIIKIVPGGRIDSSFGQNGIATLNYNDVSCYSYKSVVDYDNNIVVAGYISGIDNVSYSPAVFRLLGNGKIDSSFSLNGASVPFPSNRGESYALAVTKNSKYVVGGWFENSTLLYRLHLPKASSVNPFTDNPENNLLLSLRPTPSLDNCTITYTIPTSGECTMTLRDESGREVRTFESNQYRTAGKHTEELDLRGLAAGVYFLQIEKGNAIQTAKLIKQ